MQDQRALTSKRIASRRIKTNKYRLQRTRRFRQRNRGILTEWLRAEAGKRFVISWSPVQARSPAPIKSSTYGVLQQRLKPAKQAHS